MGRDHRCDSFQGNIQASQAGQLLRIGFWNIRDLSNSSRDSSELAQIASIAKEFDCLAICEINDNTVLRSLKYKLNGLEGRWSYRTGAKVGNTPSTAERCGFLFRYDKLRVRGTPRVLPPVSYTPPGESAREFDREPFVCSFKTLDGRFDFTVLVVHITWGSKTTYRIGEVQSLTNYYETV